MTIQALPFILLAGLLAGSSLIDSRFGVGQFQQYQSAGLTAMLLTCGPAITVLLVHCQTLWLHG